MIKIDGKVTANYDRDWDVHPTDKATETAIEIHYDHRMSIELLLKKSS